jgi:two-component system chemotaxis response regulator CheY
MNILVAEDDFSARKVLQKFLSPYGECDFAVDGEEAMYAFKLALRDNNPYDLVCLDIMMPKKDGHQVLKEIRELENERGIYGLQGVKIIMITALDDPKNIMDAFKSQCEAYITKPIDKNELQDRMRNLGLIE